MSWKQRFEESKKKIDTPEVKKSEKNNEIVDKYENMNLFKEILEGFTIYAKKFPKLLLVFGSCAVIFALLSVLIFTNIEWNTVFVNFQFKMDEYALLYGEELSEWPLEIQGEMLNAYYTYLIMQFIRNNFKFMAFTISWLILAKYLSENIKKKEYSLKNSLQDVFKKENIKNIIFYLLFINVLFSFGISFLIIPGIAFMMLIGFSFHVLPTKKASFSKLLKVGYALGDKFRLKTFFLMLIGVSFYMFFAQTLTQSIVWFHTGVFTSNISAYRVIWLNPETFDFWSIFYAEFIELFTTALFQPLIICFIAVQFVEIEINKKINWNDSIEVIEYESRGTSSNENKETAEDIESIKRPKGKQGKSFAHVIKAKGGSLKYYCPKCGQRVIPKPNQTTVKCENCGLSVHIMKK